MSITVTNATIAEGYSGYDHLIDNSPLRKIVGCTFPSLQAAAKAAGKALRGTQDKRCAPAPVWIETEDGSWRVWGDGSVA